jgi:hypothetical protein
MIAIAVRVLVLAGGHAGRDIAVAEVVPRQRLAIPDGHDSAAHDFIELSVGVVAVDERVPARRRGDSPRGLLRRGRSGATQDSYERRQTEGGGPT